MSFKSDLEQIQQGLEKKTIKKYEIESLIGLAEKLADKDSPKTDLAFENLVNQLKAEVAGEVRNQGFATTKDNLRKVAAEELDLHKSGSFSAQYVGLGIGLGVGVGTALGVSLDQLALGVSIGLSIGLAGALTIGGIREQEAEREGKIY
jgi:hypothetical protein